MAERAHLEILWQGADVWNSWRKENQVTPGFADARLRMAILEGANLQAADFVKADLTKACLTEADLTRADLRQANLEKASLERANLEGADLRDSNLEGADLSRPLPKSSGAGLKGRVLQDGVRDVIGASNGSAIRSSADLA